MEIKNRKSFNSLIKSLTLEVIKEEELDEITGTSGAPGYNTPFAFKKKKRKKVDEAINDKDLKMIRKVIRDVVGNIFRDIWLKRTAWK